MVRINGKDEVAAGMVLQEYLSSSSIRRMGLP